MPLPLDGIGTSGGRITFHKQEPDACRLQAGFTRRHHVASGILCYWPGFACYDPSTRHALLSGHLHPLCLLGRDATV